MASTTDSKSHTIENEQQLRQRISTPPKMLHKRVQPQLDHYCLEFIQHSKLAALACADSQVAMNIIAGDQIEVRDPTTISLNADVKLSMGSSASLYFLIPGIGHGLRVNGRVEPNCDRLQLTVEGAYFHCARAAARAKLWQPAKIDEPGPSDEIDWFITHSPYLLLKTQSAQGTTELSPRGDPAGFVLRQGSDQLFIPERPGNKIAVSLRNILSNAEVELMFVVPGVSQTLCVRACAELSDDPQLLSRADVQGKVPTLGIVLKQCRFEFGSSTALTQAELWSPERHTNPRSITTFAKALAAHINGDGWKAKIAAPVFDGVIKRDMKNLY